MQRKKTDIAIIGGGPAGMAAAVRAAERKCGKITLIERETDLGGILNQCIHDGFGLHRFRKQLSGAEYSQRFIDMVARADIEVLTDCMAVSLNNQREVYCSSPEHGFFCLEARSVILAMGCRERTRSQAGILGSRPAGVMTAGAVQKYININGYLPGKNAVILGSGDIGLIMARRMALEGINVTGVYEVMQSPGGLRRNIAQCLHDYNIPLHLATTVTRIHGKKRIEGVTVAKVSEDRSPIPGTEQFLPCDLLVLSVGLIPENELSTQAGIEFSPQTRGPVLDNSLMTSVPGIFAAGNVAAVFDLVDYVSETGEAAAEGAARYLAGVYAASGGKQYYKTLPGDNVAFVVPQNIRVGQKKLTLYLRVQKVLRKAIFTISVNGNPVHTQRHAFAAPPEMVVLSFTLPECAELNGDVTVSVTGE